MNWLSRLDRTDKVKLVLLVVAIGLGVVVPYVVNNFILGLVSLSIVSGLFAMSIDLMAGYAGLVTLGHAGVLATAMYGSGYMATRTDVGFWIQVAVGLACGLIVAAVFGVMAMRSSGVYFIMITIAQGMIVWGLSLRLNRVTGAENGILGIRRPEVVGADWKFYYVILVVALLCSFLMYVVVKSPFGFALKGLRESETRIRMLGHNTDFLKFYLFLISGFFASIAGILLVYLNEFVSPSDVVLAASAFPVLMAILGGIGTLVGPMIGAFIIEFVRNYVSLEIDRWQTLLGVIFIVVILFAREGLVGAISKWWHSRYGDGSGEIPAPDTEAAVSLARST